VGIGTSIFLIALGAILKYAVTAEADGLDLNNVGVILMVVGLLGLVLSLAFWNSWGGFGGRRDVVVEGGGTRRRRVIEEDI
jgi:hypothetical protein